MKYSRGAESEADLLGGVNPPGDKSPGHNPLELANFFENSRRKWVETPAPWRSGFLPTKPRQPRRRHSKPNAIHGAGPSMLVKATSTRRGKMCSPFLVGSNGKGEQRAAPERFPKLPAPDFPISQNLRRLNTGGLSLEVPDNWHAGRQPAGHSVADPARRRRDGRWRYRSRHDDRRVPAKTGAYARRRASGTGADPDPAEPGKN